MLTLGFARRIFIYRSAVDMRKSFDTLAGLVALELKADPSSGDAFVFLGKARNRVKILIFDRSGYWVLAKRLASGQFGSQGHFRHAQSGAAQVELSSGELQLLLEGVEIERARYRRQYPQVVVPGMSAAAPHS